MVFLEKPRQLFKHEWRRVPKGCQSEKALRLIEYHLLNNGIERATCSNPFALRIMTRRCLELLRGLVVDQGADIQFVEQNSAHLRCVPGAARGRSDAISIKRLGNGAATAIILRKLP